MEYIFILHVKCFFVPYSGTMVAYAHAFLCFLQCAHFPYTNIFSPHLEIIPTLST